MCPPDPLKFCGAIIGGFAWHYLALLRVTLITFFNQMVPKPTCI